MFIARLLCAGTGDIVINKTQPPPTSWNRHQWGNPGYDRGDPAVRHMLWKGTCNSDCASEVFPENVDSQLYRKKLKDLVKWIENKDYKRFSFAYFNKDHLKSYNQSILDLRFISRVQRLSYLPNVGVVSVTWRGPNTVCCSELTYREKRTAAMSLLIVPLGSHK